MSLPSGVSPWNSILGPGRRSKYNTSSGPANTFLHQQIPATTSPGPANTFLHQQIPVLNQRPLSCTSRRQQLPVLNQRPLSCTSRYQQLPVLDQWTPSCTSRYQSLTSDPLSNEYQSCTNYPDLLQRLDPAPTITIRPQRLFAVRFFDLRFAIIKFRLSKKTLVLSFLPSSLSITYISKVCGDQYIYLASAIPDLNKWYFYAALLSTQNYKVKVKGKVEQSREWSCNLLNTSV